MNKRLEELVKQRLDITNEIYALEKEEINKTQRPRLKKMVGWCMKDDTCYDDPRYGYKSFSKILDLIEGKNGDMHFIMERITINSQGSVSLSIISDEPHTNKEWWDAEIPIYGVKRISLKKYEAEKKKLMNELKNRSILKKYLKA